MREGAPNLADLRYHGGSILGDPTYSEEKEKRNERKDSLIWGLGGAAFGRERKDIYIKREREKEKWFGEENRSHFMSCFFISTWIHIRINSSVIISNLFET